MARIGRAIPIQQQGSDGRYLGPRLPIGLKPLAVITTPGHLRVRTTLAARPDRLTYKKRYPPQWLESSRASETGFSTSFVRPSFQRALGPHPPTVVIALPPIWLQKTRVTLVAIPNRGTWVDRFPRQWMEPAMIKQTGNTVVWGAFERGIGVDPPQLILPLPTLKMMTVTVTLVALRTVREALTVHKPKSRLSAPAVITPRVLAPPVDVVLKAIADRVARQQRKPHFDLFSPQVLSRPPPPPLTTKFVTSRPRLTHSRLFPPILAVSVPPAPPIEVSLRAVEQRRIGVRSFLYPPAVVNVPVQRLDVYFAESIKKGRNRIAQVYTASVPIFVPPPPPPPPPVPPVVTTLAVYTFPGRSRLLSYWQRQVLHIYWGPAIVNPPSNPPVQTTLSVHDTLRVTRAYRSRLSPPAVVRSVPTRDQTTLRLTKVVRVTRGFRSRLSPPTVVLPLPTLRMQTIVTRFGRRVTRPAQSVLRPPTALRVTVFSGPETSLVRRVTRPFKSILRPPRVVLPVPTQREQTIRTRLVARVTRPGRTRFLRLPTAVSIPPVPRENKVRVHLQPRVSRRHLTRLHAPMRIGPHQISYLVPLYPGAVGLIPQSAGTVTLTPDTPGSLTLTPDTPGTLTMTPTGSTSLSLPASTPFDPNAGGVDLTPVDPTIIDPPS